jgi:hypothetical protein
MTGTFWKLGYKNRKWINLSMVKFVSDTKRGKWLAKLENRFASLKSITTVKGGGLRVE